MNLKDILILLDAGEACEARLAFAAGLAKRHAATLTALCLFEEPAPSMADGYAIGRAAAADVLDRRNAAVERLLAPVEASLHRVAAEAAVPCCWSPPSLDHSLDGLALRARSADVAVVGRSRTARMLAEHLALTSGSPCVMLGADETLRPFDRVMVAWDGSRASKRALADGMGFLSQARAVQVTTLVDDTFRRPLPVPQADLLRHLCRHGVEADGIGTPLRGEDTGEALLRQARQWGADLLILGAYGRARGIEAVLGGVTRTVMAQAQLAVMISH